MAVDYETPAVGDIVSEPAASPDAATAESPSGSLAVVRFHSCRWRKAPEDGEGEYCTHRDVLPLTGKTGFDPEAWCTDCAFFKLRRTPRKNNNNH